MRNFIIVLVIILVIILGMPSMGECAPSAEMPDGVDQSIIDEVRGNAMHQLMHGNRAVALRMMQIAALLVDARGEFMISTNRDEKRRALFRQMELLKFHLELNDEWPLPEDDACGEEMGVEYDYSIPLEVK